MPVINCTVALEVAISVFASGLVSCPDVHAPPRRERLGTRYFRTCLSGMGLQSLRNQSQSLGNGSRPLRNGPSGTGIFSWDQFLEQSLRNNPSGTVSQEQSVRSSPTGTASQEQSLRNSVTLTHMLLQAICLCAFFVYSLLVIEVILYE